MNSRHRNTVCRGGSPWVALDWMLLIGVALAHLVMLRRSSSPWGAHQSLQTLSDYGYAVQISLWVLIPYLLISVTLWYFSSNKMRVSILTLCLIPFLIFSVYALMRYGDARGGIVLLVLPIFQLAVIGAMVAFVAILHHRGRSTSGRHRPSGENS